MVCHAWERKVLEIRYCRYVSDAKESLVVKGTNYTMFVPDLNAEVNLAVSATMRECGDVRHECSVGSECLRRHKTAKERRERGVKGHTEEAWDVEGMRRILNIDLVN